MVTWFTKPTKGSFSNTEIDVDRKLGGSLTSLFNKHKKSVECCFTGKKIFDPIQQLNMRIQSHMKYCCDC